jgi:DNA adenine methylase
MDEELITNLENLTINEQKFKNKSPLRYPGGKSKACKKLDYILNKHFNTKEIKNIISPFIGGSSFEYFLQNKYNYNIYANDKFEPLYNFWNCCKFQKLELCKELESYIKKSCTKNDFIEIKKTILNEKNQLKKAVKFFILNRCSFNGCVMNSGFSLEASKKRFTMSSIKRIQNLNLEKFYIYNLDFKDFLNLEFIKKNNSQEDLIFLDPPYYLLNKSNLYGNNGNLHKNFNHKELYNILCNKNNWIMTYNNCDYIKKLYKDFIIIETNWAYGMNKTKKSFELVIINN